MKDQGIRYVIVDRGFVFAGRVIEEDATGSITLKPAVCVRRWGGEGRGIGYTPEHGPVGNDKVDGVPGGVHVPALSVICTLGCNQEKWSAVIETACAEASK